MNKQYWIFISDEGFTVCPFDQDTDNPQVIGYAYGDTVEDALDYLLEESPHLKGQGFRNVYAYRLGEQNPQLASIEGDEE